MKIKEMIYVKSVQQTTKSDKGLLGLFLTVLHRVSSAVLHSQVYINPIIHPSSTKVWLS